MGAKEYAATLAAGGSKEDAATALRDARRAADGAGSTVTVLIGPTKDVRYASLVEFGTVKAAAQPYMRPAWDAEKVPVQGRIKAEVKSEIDKAVARAAKRAAKLAAKG